MTEITGHLMTGYEARSCCLIVPYALSRESTPDGYAELPWAPNGAILVADEMREYRSERDPDTNPRANPEASCEDLRTMWR